MRQIFRRNTSPSPVGAPPSETTIGFGIPTTVEKLTSKKGTNIRFRERDRVKIIAPPEFAHKTGYIVEAHDVQNEQGLIEIELDHQLDEADGYEKLRDPTVQRPRLTIKNPDRQLTAFRYMKCQGQHFLTAMRADSLSELSRIISYLLCAQIVSIVLTIESSEQDSTWHSPSLYIAYVLCSCISIGLGFCIILLALFIANTIRRLSTENNLLQNGSIHDECISYYWYKSMQWKPFWWLCKGGDYACIEYICQHFGKAVVSFVLFFMVSIVLYVSDRTEWYILTVCVVSIVMPSLLVLHIIIKRDMLAV